MGLRMDEANGLKMAGGCVVAALVFCGMPFYCFFFHCPDPPPSYLAARRAIHVGMNYEVVKKLMPGEFYTHSDKEMVEADGDLGNLPPATEGKGFTGYLVIIEPCSVQCQAELRIRVESDVVVQVILEVYNDLDHSTREIE
jgi:hypothetical protein